MVGGASLIESWLKFSALIGQVDAEIATATAQAGARGSMYRVLRSLVDTEEQRAPAGRIGASIGIGTPGMTKLLDQMEKAGLIERHRHPGDRRVADVTPTSLGLDALEQADRQVAAIMREIFVDGRLEAIYESAAKLLSQAEA